MSQMLNTNWELPRAQYRQNVIFLLSFALQVFLDIISLLGRSFSGFFFTLFSRCVLAKLILLFFSHVEHMEMARTREWTLHSDKNKFIFLDRSLKFGDVRFHFLSGIDVLCLFPSVPWPLSSLMLCKNTSWKSNPTLI